MLIGLILFTAAAVLVSEGHPILATMLLFIIFMH
jgi:hypothetical protein